jgi:hypothetical protein
VEDERNFIYLPGYAPLMVRIVQMMCANAIQQNVILEGLKLLPGPFLDFTQPIQAEELVNLLGSVVVQNVPRNSV